MKEYNADSIKVLDDISHIRLRYGMYIGNNETPLPLLNEAIDNAVDEVANGYSDGFTLKINKSETDDITYTVIDNGRGIPTGHKYVNGTLMSVLEAVTTKANSGGKFDNDAYLNSAGLNGVGLVCVTALADAVHIESVNNKQLGILDIKDGSVVKPVDYKNTDRKSGTLISFTVNKDTKYFENNQILFDDITAKLNAYQAFGVTNIRLFLNDEDVTDSYITATSPFSLHKHPMDNGDNALVIDRQVKSDKGELFRITMNYINGSSTSYKFNGYTNYLYNKDGGGHILAAQDAIVGAFEKFCKSRSITIPSNMNSDYFIGLNAIVHCNIAEKAFASQTKDKLITGTGTTRDYFKELVILMTDAICEEFEKHVGITKALVQRIADYRKERENRKELKGLSQYITINQSTSNTVRRGSVYDKLTECNSKNRDECELIMTEGDSASGGLIRTRNRSTTAILPLKGKIKNVVGCSITDTLKNKEIAGIISSVGCGILDKCDINRIRYNEILYAADADADGAHITNLVVALFVTLMPDVVKAGKLKLILSPLYGYKDKQGNWQGAYSFEELPKDIAKSGKFERYKGLGSLDDDQVKEFLLNKEKRRVVTVGLPSDLDEFNDVMSTSEGKRNLLRNLGILTE